MSVGHISSGEGSFVKLLMNLVFKGHFNDHQMLRSCPDKIVLTATTYRLLMTANQFCLSDGITCSAQGSVAPC